MKDTLVLRDEHNQTLKCEILKQVELEDMTYALITPVDHYVEILVWTESPSPEDEEDEDFEGVLDEPDPAELVDAQPTMQAVLAELNLQLQQSAFGLMTVQGELPDPQEEDILEIAKDGDEIEEYQLLTTFFHNDRQYGIFTPLDPLLLYAAQPEDAPPYLLTADHPDSLFEQLYDQLLDLAEEDG
ncbi:MAG: DUF3727 domain-containing protein [Cyanobacteriota bacterium]|nr:DUF3727 domain-containing protein [Cyanobacteriota bacterium]